jgi:hypothetical protein
VRIECQVYAGCRNAFIAYGFISQCGPLDQVRTKRKIRDKRKIGRKEQNRIILSLSGDPWFLALLVKRLRFVQEGAV